MKVWSMVLMWTIKQVYLDHKQPPLLNMNVGVLKFYVLVLILKCCLFPAMPDL